MTRYFIAAVAVYMFSTQVLMAQPLSVDNLEFPYEALVLRDGAPVRSGPGNVHYATDELAQGSVIEVYRHDPGGWCAIRPPAGSFSLVPESAIEIIEQGVGRIVAGSAQAWVGTRLGVVENPLWQVKLKEDELVEILGEVGWPNPEGHSTLWYQIAPPAGEFRWIQISDLQLPDGSTRLPLPDSSQANGHNRQLEKIPRLQTSMVNIADIPFQGPAQDFNVRPVALQTESPGTEIVDSIPDSLAKSINSGWRPARRKIDRDSAIGKHVSNQPPNQFTAPAIPSLDASQATTQFERSSYGAAPNAQPPTQPATRMASANMEFNPTIHTPSADVSRLPPNNGYAYSNGAPIPNPILSSSPQLNQLEMALTNEMLKPPASWRLDDLLLQTEGVIIAATDPRVTQHGNWLLAKIQRCQIIRSEFRDANNNSTANTGAAGILKGPVGTGINTEVELGTTYDAYGWLNELVRDNGTSPSTFVLQDENGKITHHVAGAPGLNLRRYLKSKVGIVGQRGYNQALNLDHVTAERVVELHVRR